jgi:hypothetical protein
MVLVRVKKPGEKITVDVMPSAYQQHALVMGCDYSTENGLFAYPAAVNASAPAPHRVDGVVLESKGWPLVSAEEDGESALPDSTR